MVPVAGVGARAAGVARAAQAAKKATMKVKEPKSNVKKKPPAKAGPARPTPEQFRQAQSQQIKWWREVEKSG